MWLTFQNNLSYLEIDTSKKVEWKFSKVYSGINYYFKIGNIYINAVTITGLVIFFLS